MTTIVTVRAALHAICAEGVTSATLFQLGSAMGPATLYVAGIAGPGGFEVTTRSDSAGRSWLRAFTTPRTPSSRGSEPVLSFHGLTGANLLRLAARDGRHLVLEAGSPLECRIPPRAAQSLQVAAGYTESLAGGRRDRLAS